VIKHGYTVLNLCYFSLKKEGQEREAPTYWGLFRILLILGVVVKGEAYSRGGGLLIHRFTVNVVLAPL